MKKIYAPFGYQIGNEEGYLDGDNEEDVLGFCLGMSDDPEFKEKIRQETHIGRLNFLTENGFEIEEE